MNEYIKCPFCGEDDFDLIGLKNHLLCHCEEFEQTEKLLTRFTMSELRENHMFTKEDEKNE